MLSYTPQVQVHDRDACYYYHYHYHHHSCYYYYMLSYTSQLQVHDRDALPQPQFVAPVLEVKAEQQAAAAKSAKGGKTLVKVPVAKPKTPSAAAFKGQPPVQAEGTSLPIAEPAAECVCCAYSETFSMTSCSPHTLQANRFTWSVGFAYMSASP